MASLPLQQSPATTRHVTSNMYPSFPIVPSSLSLYRPAVVAKSTGLHRPAVASPSSMLRGRPPLQPATPATSTTGARVALPLPAPRLTATTSLLGQYQQSVLMCATPSEAARRGTDLRRPRSFSLMIGHLCSECNKWPPLACVTVNCLVRLCYKCVGLEGPIPSRNTSCDVEYVSFLSNSTIKPLPASGGGKTH